MSVRNIIESWVETFNDGDVDGMMVCYAEDASLHIVHAEPVESRAAIRALFESYFAAAKMNCIVEKLSIAGNTAILEWRDTIGLRGCNIFEVEDGAIRRQRNYFDQLTFYRKQGIPIPEQ